MEKINVNVINISASDDIEENMYQTYMTSSARNYLLKLGLTDEIVHKNIAKLYDFIQDYEYCKNCKGLANCEKENPFLCTKITFENDFVDSQLIPCKAKSKKMLLEKQFYIRDFPYEWLENSLKDLDQQNYRKYVYKKYIDFKNKNINNWIFIKGSSNSGKTYLAATMTVDAVKANKGPVVFASCSTRIRELVDLSFNDKKDFQNELYRYSNVPILVLDDFGNEFKNDHVRDSIIIPILSNRSTKRLFTIITSDFSYEDLLKLYTTNSAGEIRAKQLLKILKTMCGTPISSGEIGTY